MKNAVFKKIVSVLLSVLTVFAFAVPSYAEELSADETEIYDFVLGDADGNGRVTAADARLVLRFAAKLITEDEINKDASDYNRDGKIVSADARMILRASARLDPFARIIPSTTEAKTEPVKPSSKIISVGTVCQYPNYPSGCEAVSAVMNLRYLGVNISVNEFVSNYLPLGQAPYKSNGVWYSSDPNVSFLGDPASSSGWGIWAKGLAGAIERCLDRQSGNFTVKYTYSETLESLCDKYTANNIPVIVWATAGMQQPYVNITAHIIGTNNTFKWISPNHCLLLVGYDSTGYYFNDPITGKREKYAKAACKTAFTGNGSQAVIITK